MKKNLLTFCLIALTSSVFSQGQVVFDVLTPDPVAGLYDFEYVSSGATGWDNVPNLLIESAAITGEMAIARDGTAGDSLGCEPLVNGAEIDGKIAMVYRGACAFALKALHCWDAGAIGVMIINNQPGAPPIVPGGGTDGTATPVDVPVGMTTFEAGAAIREDVIAGNVTAFIGLQNFENNLVITPGNVLRPQGAAFPLAITEGAEQFIVPMGSFVGNLGTEVQNNVTLTATVSKDGQEIYNESGSVATIDPNDTVFVALPDFSEEEYSLGKYTITYTVDSDNEEEFPVDNGPIDASIWMMEDVFSFSPISADGVGATPQAFRPATFEDPFAPCVHFRHSNASRLRLEGMSTSVAKSAADGPVTGLVLSLEAYEWNDEFEGLAIAIDNLDVVRFGAFLFEDDDQDVPVYIPFEAPLDLVDNQRYLFCVSSSDPLVFLGYGPSTYDYTAAQAAYETPSFPLLSGESFFLNGFGEDLPPGHTVHFTILPPPPPISTDNVEQVDITPFPNPSVEMVHIPYSGNARTASINVLDMSGRLVKSVNANFAGENVLDVDMTGVENGTYIFDIQFDNNTRSTFKVVMAK